MSPLQQRGLTASIAIVTSGAHAAVDTNVTHDLGVMSFGEADIVMTSQTRAERRAARQAARQARRDAINNNGGTTVVPGTGNSDPGIPALVSVPGPAAGQQPSQAQFDALIAANFPNGLPPGSRIRSVASEGVRILVRGAKSRTRTFPFNQRCNINITAASFRSRVLGLRYGTQRQNLK